MTIRNFDLDKLVTVREVLAAVEAAGGYEKWQNESHSIDLGEFGRESIDCDAQGSGFDSETFEASLLEAIDAHERAAA